MLQGPVFLGMPAGLSFVCARGTVVTLLGLATALQLGAQQRVSPSIRCPADSAVGLGSGMCFSWCLEGGLQ